MFGQLSMTEVPEFFCKRVTISFLLNLIRLYSLEPGPLVKSALRPPPTAQAENEKSALFPGKRAEISGRSFVTEKGRKIPKIRPPKTIDPPLKKMTHQNFAPPQKKHEKKTTHTQKHKKTISDLPKKSLLPTGIKCPN